jgi:subtilisin family serine protease
MFKLNHLFAAGVLFAVSGLCASTPLESVILTVNKPYGKVIAAIEARGGKVTHQFKHTGALTVQLSPAALAEIAAVNGVLSVSKDPMIQVGPGPIEKEAKRLGLGATLQVAGGVVTQLSQSEIRTLSSNAELASYNVSNTLMGLGPLFTEGYQGTGVVVAVIDSGLRPGFPHIAGSVIGGEDLVGDGLGYENAALDPHGTFVSGMISSHITFLMPNERPLVQALNAYAPGAAKPYNDTMSRVPLVGTAPGASLYMIRVMSTTGTGPTSRIMSGIERVIELRERYDAGLPDGLNIKVCNMSLGSVTLDPGWGALDQLIDSMLEHDIVPVVAVGNSGPAPMTVGSPATSKSAISVGGASLAYNERIVTDLAFGPGKGALYRPYPAHLMYFASSRGPDANGKIHPDVVASAHWNAGMCDEPATISFESGTSTAAPSVAGIAAVLRQAYPKATARQIRNAIILSANPDVLTAADVLDQGHGFVDGGAASNLLASGTVPDTVDPLPDASPWARVNIEKNTTLKVHEGFVHESVSAKPGERHEIIYRVLPNTAQVVVSISNFSALPPEQQNQLQGDNFSFGIHTAKFSWGDDYISELRVYRNGTEIVNNPGSGLIRIVMNGNAHNVGEVSAEVTVFSLTNEVLSPTKWGTIAAGATVVVPFTVPAGTDSAKFRLAWKDDWGKVPAADLDLYLLSPSAKLNLEGATETDPEMVSIQRPEPGKWLAIIFGFNIPAGSDTYEFEVNLDGKVVH